MPEQPHITEHARSRAKERLGLKLCALKRLAATALAHGIGAADTRGQLRRYLDEEAMKASALPMVYGCHVFIFGEHESLITVWELPHELRRSAEQAKARKGGVTP
jgi:hypothetical protein